MLTDNNVLVRRHKPQPALLCVQRKASKIISTEEDFIKANIASFGNEIGQTTNWITSMFEVRAGCEQGSAEYEALSYRIRCGQLYQQNVIDKAKGIIATPMPRYWHDRHSISNLSDPDERELCRRIVANKKPYFMRYIYPALMRQYNTYIRNTNCNSLREFDLTVPELKDLPYRQLTERQIEFLKYYDQRMPVGVNDCVMNRICKRFEQEFDGYVGKRNSQEKFDYRFMRGHGEYTPKQFTEIRKLYDEFNRRISHYAIFANHERIDEYDSLIEMSNIRDEFVKRCAIICPNPSTLCNLVLDLCYKRKATKWFAWNMCGGQIIKNLLDKNDHLISFPTIDACGDIEYCGNTFRTDVIRLEDDEVIE